MLNSVIVTLSVLAFIAIVVAVVFIALYCKKSKTTEAEENSVLEEAKKRAKEAEAAAEAAKKAAEEAEAKAKKAAADAEEQIALADEHAEKAVAEAEAAKKEAEAAKKAAEEAEKAAEAAKKAADEQAAAAAKKAAEEAEAAAADEIEGLRIAVADIGGSIQHFVDSVAVLKNDIAEASDPATGLFAQLKKLAGKFRMAKAKAKVAAENARDAAAKVSDATANKRSAEEIKALNEHKISAEANAKKAEEARQSARNALVALKHNDDPEVRTFETVLAELKSFDAAAFDKVQTNLNNRLSDLANQQRELATKLPDSEPVKAIGREIDRLAGLLAREDISKVARGIETLVKQLEAAVQEIDDLLADKV